MPNLCHNWIRITGPEVHLAALRPLPFTIDIVDKMPEHLEGEERKKWIDTFWGTRLMASDEKELRFEEVDEGLEINFVSAWCPPIPLYERLRETFNGIRFEYEALIPMMGLIGYGIDDEEKIFNLDTREDLKKAQAARKWRLEPFDLTGESDDEEDIQPHSLIH